MKKLLSFLLLALCCTMAAWADDTSVRGDVNGDGSVNAADISALIDHLLDETQVICDGDVNCDGTVNMSDLTALIDYLLRGYWLDGETYTVNGVSFTMRPVDGGYFRMGTDDSPYRSPDDYDWPETPSHAVHLSSFYIGVTEVTQALWQAVMGESQADIISRNRGGTYGIGDNLAVYDVTWDECEAFITRLNELTGQSFRFPTEAEWEYAAKGGQHTHGHEFAGSDSVDEVSWYYRNARDVGRNHPDYGVHAVASKKPNELGLYDMSGNVGEWCYDWYGNYSPESQNNPHGPSEGTQRVNRGGSWFDSHLLGRVTSRTKFYPATPNFRYGLRLAKDKLVDAPVITTQLDDDALTVTATGNGRVTLSVNGYQVSNPYRAQREFDDYTIHVYATAKEGENYMNERSVWLTVPPRGTFTANGVTFKMVYVDGGTFTMGVEEGTPDAAEDEWPAHEVTLTNYFIGQTEVTQELWQAVMGSNPSTFSSRYEYEDNLQRPVETVSREECLEFITRLNGLTRKTFRLPTEAEWEFAARGGNMSQGYKYPGSNDVNEVAWYSGNSDEVTHAVAAKAPNELGIYDMGGNVSEWCNDWYGNYSSDAQTDPQGPLSGYTRVCRGGALNAYEHYCRVTKRDNANAIAHGWWTGLRLVLDNTVTSFPEITCKTKPNEMIFTAKGKGDVVLYVNGQAVENPCSMSRGETPYDITIQATAKEEGKKMGTSPLETITIPAEDYQIYTVNGVNIKMLPVDGGTFTMGDNRTTPYYENTAPAHRVTLQDFSIGKTEVTQELWEAVMGESQMDVLERRGDGAAGIGPNYPMYDVTWEECQQFIAELNRLTGLNFRLPTEAEWEFAACGGNLSEGYFYSGGFNDDDVGWCYYGHTYPVASKISNELGLFDMTGNVSEWCQDWYGAYTSEAQTDPTGPATGTYRVRRGGSFNDHPFDCGVLARSYSEPDKWSTTFGLRLVLSGH